MPDYASRYSGTYGKTQEEAERRADARSQVTAAAEVVDLSSGTRFSTRISDLSSGGCFVDTLTPLPVGSRVRVTLFARATSFETVGKVVYTQHGLGMGISFGDMEPAQREAFEEWLGAQGQATSVLLSSAPEPPIPESGGNALLRLVNLLVGKGIISEEEARVLRHEPLP